MATQTIHNGEKQFAIFGKVFNDQKLQSSFKVPSYCAYSASHASYEGVAGGMQIVLVEIVPRFVSAALSGPTLQLVTVVSCSKTD